MSAPNKHDVEIEKIHSIDRTRFEVMRTFRVTVKYLCRAFVIIGLAWSAVEVAPFVGGKTTTFIFGKITPWQIAVLTLCPVVAVLGVCYGLLQRRERIEKVGELTKRIEFFERHFDPTRSSSHLTRTGQAQREDRE